MLFQSRILTAALLLASMCLADDVLPNVVFILADDLGFNDIGYHGKDHGSAAHTPNLDRMASEGVKLENYYVQPICSPTRAQLLSGRYQIHMGLQHSIIHEPQPSCLPLDEVTLPQKLKESGYTTHMVGKWHLGFYQPACTPTHRGFDSFFGFLTGSQDHYEHTMTYNHIDPPLTGDDLYDNTTPVAPLYRGQYSTHLYTRKAIELIENHDKKKPMFLYLPYQAAHGPLQVPREYEDRYANITNHHRKSYLGMVTCLDEGVENITQALKQAGMYENTVIIFSTDNGGQILVGGNNWPLRGNKGTLWEGGIHGIGFVNSPLLPAAIRGTFNRELMHITDWLPTIVSGIAGGALNGTKKLDGFNVWESITTGKESPRKELLHNIDQLYHKPAPIHKGPADPNKFDTAIRAALRVGDWKIQTGLGDISEWTPPPESGQEQVYPNRISDQQVWLFNITADPAEEHEVSEQYPEVVDRLLRRLNEYYEDSIPIYFPDPDLNANPALHGGIWGPWVGATPEVASALEELYRSEEDKIR